MASAEVVYEAPVNPPIDKIVLHLTENEAQIIFALVSGSDVRQPGVESIWRALKDKLTQKYRVAKRDGGVLEAICFQERY